MGQYCNHTEKTTTGSIFPILRSLTSNEASIQVNSVTFQLIHAASCNSCSYITPDHDDVIKWKLFTRYWPFVRGIHRSPVNSTHKGQWPGALVFSLICALNKRLSKQSWGWWFETSSRLLWRHCNGCVMFNSLLSIYAINPNAQCNNSTFIVPVILQTTVKLFDVILIIPCYECPYIIV